jgi:hypothetical protein
METIAIPTPAAITTPKGINSGGTFFNILILWEIVWALCSCFGITILNEFV